MKYSRRRFITRSILASAGCARTVCRPASRAVLSATTEDPLPISRHPSASLGLRSFSSAVVEQRAQDSRAALCDDRVSDGDTRGLNVVKAVYMEVDVDPKQQVEEALHVIELSKSDEHPTVGAVISGRPNAENFANYINQFKDSCYIKGVRQVLQGDSTPAGSACSRSLASRWIYWGASANPLTFASTERVRRRIETRAPPSRYAVHSGPLW